MILNQIPIMDIVEIRFLRENKTQILKTKVDETDLKKISVILPIELFQKRIIRENCELLLFYQVDDSEFVWNCKAGEIKKSNNVPILEIFAKSELGKLCKSENDKQLY